MEDSGILDTTNSLHMFALHLVFLPRINLALQEYLEAFNHHKMRTAQNWSPYQMWVNNMKSYFFISPDFMSRPFCSHVLLCCYVTRWAKFGRVFCKQTNVANVDFKMNVIKWKLHFVSCNFGLKFVITRLISDLSKLHSTQCNYHY